MLDAHEDPAFQAMCREHEIEGTAQVALCGEFWNRALVSGAGAEPQCVVRMAEGAREPEFVSWNAFPVGSHKLYAAPGAAIAAREQGSDHARFDYMARSLRSIADRGRAELGDSYPEILSLCSTMRDLASREEAPAASEQTIFIDFKQATDLLAMFGGEPNEITLHVGEGHSGRGMYASYTDMPEEGTIFLGNSDQEAMPDTPSAATPVAPGEVTLRALHMADMQLSAWENGYAFDTHGPSREAQRLVTEAIAALAHPAPVAAPAPSMDNFEHVIQWVRDNYQDNNIASLCDGLRAAYYALCRPAAPAPASEAVAWNIPDQCPHMIVFDDAEASPLTFAGSGARPAALEAFKRKSIQWNAHLFVRIAHNSRDDTYPDATPGDSVDASVQQAVDPTGKPLNTAGWAFINALPVGAHLNGHAFNNVKPALKTAIEAYFAALKGEQPEPSGSERGNAA